MPGYFVDKIIQEFNSIKGLNILILGISYRPNVKEIEFSGAIELKNLLLALGATVYAQDPFYTKNELSDLGFGSSEISFVDYDVIILHTNHKEFNNLDFNKYPKCKQVLDGRNYFSKNKMPININFYKYGNLNPGNA
jgi:UDP-N-acetyl-D-mannosaminuronate dehydrogenase